jgi:isopenicillin N synthase-like dioxygenase
MGFSQVVNHGTPREVTDEMFTQSRAFFTQPVAQKREVLRTQANPWGFYDRGLTKNRRDLKEIYDFGPPDGATIRPQWPQRLPRFRNAVQSLLPANRKAGVPPAGRDLDKSRHVAGLSQP